MTRVEDLNNQSIDTIKENPLANVNEIPQPQKTNSTKLLFGLSLLLISLLIISIIAVILKKEPITTPYTPTPTIIPTPTLNQSELPQKWQKRLEDREAETRIEEDFLPPQIDTNIGL